MKLHLCEEPRATHIHQITTLTAETPDERKILMILFPKLANFLMRDCPIEEVGQGTMFAVEECFSQCDDPWMPNHIRFSRPVATLAAAGIEAQ